MISKSERDRVSILRARLARGIAQRSVNLEEWSENAQFYLDGQGDSRLVGDYDHEVIINKIFSTLRAQLPALMFQRPKWEVHARRKKIVEGRDIAPELAAAREHLLNYWWQELKIQFQVRLAIIASKLAYGCIKVGYTPDFEANPKAGKFREDDEGRLEIGGDGLPVLEQGDYLRDDDGHPVIDPETGIPLLEPGEILTNEHFFVKFVHWSRLIFDPEGENDFDEHAWIAEEWCRPTAEIRANTLFNSNRKHVQATECVGKFNDNGDMLGVDMDSSSPEPNMGSAVRSDEERTRGYTIYDFKKRRIQVIAESSTNKGAHDFLLRDDPLPPEQEHGPYCFLRLNENPGHWEPIPDVTPMRSPQEEINILRSKLLTHVSRGDRKYGYLEGAFDDEEALEQLQGGGDMTLVKMTDPMGVWPIPQAPMDNAIFSAALDMSKSFDEVAGQSAEARQASRSQTATQASIAESHGQARESDQRELIHQFVVDIGRKLDQTLSVNMSQDVWVGTADATRPFPYPNGDNGMTVSPADLAFEADIDIEVGSMLPKTDAMMRQQLMQVLEILVKGGPLLLQSPALLDQIFEMWEINNTEITGELVEIATRMQQAQEQQAAPGGSGQPGSLPTTVGGQANPAGGMPNGSIQ